MGSQQENEDKGGIKYGSLVASSILSGDASPSRAVSEISPFLLYTLRASYLVLALGLGVYVWPSVISHTNDFAATRGVQVALLAGLSATAALGLRYPVKMLPLLLFELVWKVIYLIAFAVPRWAAHQINAAVAETYRLSFMVVIFLPLIPWRYLFAKGSRLVSGPDSTGRVPRLTGSNGLPEDFGPSLGVYTHHDQP